PGHVHRASKGSPPIEQQMAWSLPRCLDSAAPRSMIMVEALPWSLLPLDLLPPPTLRMSPLPARILPLLPLVFPLLMSPLLCPFLFISLYPILSLFFIHLALVR